MAAEPGSKPEFKQRDAEFTTISGQEIEPLYGPEDVDPDLDERVGEPGEYPFTRGPYPSMYRGRLWTMRQFAGFGTVEETNERFHYLLDHGQTGLSTAFDMPALMGYASDHERSLGEVGREGVAVDTLDDMEQLFAGIPLGGVTTSMTINAPAAILLAYYVLVGESQGVPPEKLGGTIQTDILKEYIAQKEWCFPIEPAMRLVTDMIEWCTEQMPRWHPVSISGYHIREAGSTAQQELAFTLKDGFTYVEGPRPRGRARARPAPSTPPPPASPSSSTPTSTSSRRSPSTGRRAGSGPARCATPTAPSARSRCGCASTLRPPASR